MERLIIITISILYSALTLATSSYQIDLILFAQPSQNTELMGDSPLTPMNAKAISLIADTEKTGNLYRLLPPSYSSLRDEYYQLSRKSHYQVLGNYSWKQPENNQSKVALPLVEHNGWQMQGIFNIRQSSYYTFDAQIQACPPSNPQSSITVSQKQRLKDNVVYYLDNANIGMVVKIHKLV